MARWLVPLLALIFALALLGRRAMHSDEAANASPHPAALASESLPAQTQAPAGGKLAADDERTPDAGPTFGTFRGRVIDAVTRKPVREFQLEFLGARATKVGDEAPGARTFRTDDGRFAWEYLPPGDWNVIASARGYQRFELIGLHLNGNEATAEIVLPLRAGHTLRGRIYDEVSGAGIASASVGFREVDTGRFEGNWRNRVRGNSGKNGMFVLDGVPPGRITLEISAQDYAGRELGVVVGDENPPLDIALSTGGLIAGRLTAADGVTAVAGSAGLFSLDKGFGSSGRTGDNGEFSYPHLSAGRYQLTGHAAGGSVAREIVLAPNQRIEGIVLALSAGHAIRGVVSGLRPEDLQRVSISLRREGDAGIPFTDVRVDDAGAYLLPGVQPGRVEVAADVSLRRQLLKTVEMPANADMTVNFDFPSGARLSGRVTRGGKPLPGVSLTPRPAVEQPVFVYGTSTSQDGTYVIEDLAAGEYTIMVADYFRTRRFQVSDDTVFDIDVPLAQLSGRVLEQGGKAPVVDADVDIWPTEPGSSRIRRRDRSDHFGQFELAGLEAGDYMLTAYKPGYGMFRKRISYDVPVAGMTISLRRDTGVEIRVRAAGGNGQPLRAILVMEMSGDQNGSRLQVRLDDDGVGYLPAALTGSTLSFSAFGYGPTRIREWDGQSLDLRLEGQKPQ